METFIASLGIFIGELYGNLVGGGSLVTQAVLQKVLMIDIKTAMALDNSAIMGSVLGMIIAMFKNHKIKKYFFLFIAFQLIGVFIGASILVNIDINILKTIFSSSIVVLLIKNLFIKDSNVKEKGFKPSALNYILLALSGLIIGTYNAAFVIGDWIIAILLLTKLLHLKYQEAVFLLVLTQVLVQPFAVYEYFKGGLIDFNLLIPMTCATFIAGIVSGNILNKIQSHVLENILKYLSVALAIYLILF
ncbi:hypothetical protein CL656_00375 [bacterium]|nr:hypothetical protein [bacterium]|tara:strand:- start:1886 stop:2626 length:741 start_codon:yes stop_codon:yes gene_type:complete